MIVARRYLLGIDVGGTAVKVGLFDLDGRLLGLYTEEIPVESPQPGWAEIDPLRWLDAVRQGVPHVLHEADVRGNDVAALGLSNMIGTVAPVDRHGHPLRKAIAYFDTRSGRQAAWILDRVPDIQQTSANRVTPGNTSLTSIFWLRDHEPQIYAVADRFLPTGSFLFRWLTGETRVDWTTASFVGPFDYRAIDWSPDIAARLRFDLARLPPVAAPQSHAGLLRDVAAELGLPAGLPVALGGIDGAMSSVGVGAIRPGDAFDVSGTSEMIAVCLPRPLFSPQLLARWHVVPEVWVLIGAVSTSGAAFRWFRDQLYPGVENEGVGYNGVGDDAARYDAMTREAEQSPPGANGVTFLPHMMGERAPIWDPNARGVFFGLTLSTTRGDMIRAIMEGAAYAMRQLIEIMQVHSGVPVRRVVTVGGAARNRLWRRIKADVWNVSLATPAVSEATVLGAALTAGVAAEVYADYAAAVSRAVPKATEVMSPDAQRHRQYERSYQLYRQLYPALADAMRFAAADET
jgi:xylulokinase